MNEIPSHRRLLVIDDTESIHVDFRKILGSASEQTEVLDELEASLFGESEGQEQEATFELDHAHQGQEGLAAVEKALAAGKPYSVAFVDMRMPPGWDGVQTVEQLWRVDPGLLVVICTAYSDYSWEDIRRRLGDSDKLLILKKPFDTVEVKQLANALTAKWLLSRQADLKMGDLEGLVAARTEDLNAANERLHEANERMKDLATRAMQGAEAKSAFLASMSHEIRTPMNGIMGVVDLLSETEMNSGQKSLVETLQSSTESLLTIINDILDFSKIESGKLTFEEKDFDLHSVVHGALELMAERAQRKGIEITAMIPEGVRTELRGDPHRLRQVILNLLSNAVKFTESGEVFLRIEPKTCAQGKVTLLFSVRDTGPGIPDEARSGLFQPFTQVDPSVTRKHGGTGLGLAICKNLVELMGGQLGVNSVFGEGATFWFTANFAVADSMGADAVTTSESLEKCRVLVVDDNETNRMVIQSYLKAWQLTVDCVSNGESAREAMHAAVRAGRPYRLVLLDYVMPDTDGGELVASLQDLYPSENTDFLLLMPLFPPVKASQLRRNGLVQTIAKPIRKRELREKIESVLTGCGPDESETLDSPRESSERPPVRRMPEKRAHRPCEILVAEDNPVNRKVAEAFFASLGLKIDFAHDGSQALAAWRSGSYRVIFMDCEMPEMDGFETARRIRAEEQQESLTPIPIVAMTAYAMEGDRERCLKAGMDDYLAKPVRKKSLQAVLERFGILTAS